jgi:hypothetical protein
MESLPRISNFWSGMLFDIPFLADWNKIGDHSQCQTDLNMKRENHSRRDWDYKVGDKVLLRKDGILRKSESWYESNPWTITSVHTNVTIRVQRGTKSGRLNIRRVALF